MTEQTFYLRPWFDAHTHMRGWTSPWCPDAFKLIVKSVARQCQYAVVMPNQPLIKTYDEMTAYGDMINSIAKIVAPDSSFTPLTTLYLTKYSSIDDIKKAAEDPMFAGWKYYPQGITTGSEDGVDDIRTLEKALGEIEKVGSRLLIHGETRKTDVDELEAEETFINEDLKIFRQMFRGKICIEHCSTITAVNAVLRDKNMWGSITPHHLSKTYNETYDPHNRCRPVLQTEMQRINLIVTAAFVDSKKFFAGTDNAPQLESKKLSKNVPNGCFSSPAAIPLYMKTMAQILPIPGETTTDEQIVIQRLNSFMYDNAANFYGLPTNGCNISTSPFPEAKILVTNVDSYPQSAEEFRFYNFARDEHDRLVPFYANELMPFTMEFLPSE